MCGKNISKNPGVLQFTSNYYKVQKMCEKALDYYHYALEYVLDC